MPTLLPDYRHLRRPSWPASDFKFRRLRPNFLNRSMLAIVMDTTSITTNSLSINRHTLVDTNMVDMGLTNRTMGCSIAHQRLHESRTCWSDQAPTQRFEESMLGAPAPVQARTLMPNPSHV